MPADPAAMDIYAESLANAKLTALRALLEIVNTTEDEHEKRQAATAILRTPEPKEPLASARGNSYRPKPDLTPYAADPPPASKPLPADPPIDDDMDSLMAELRANLRTMNELNSPFLPKKRALREAEQLAATAGAAPPDPRSHSP